MKKYKLNTLFRNKYDSLISEDSVLGIKMRLPIKNTLKSYLKR